MRKTFGSIIEAMGGKVIERNRALRSRTLAPTDEGISIGGEIIHEVGHDAHGRRARARRC